METLPINVYEQPYINVIRKTIYVNGEFMGVGACSSLTTTEVHCLLRFSEVRNLKKGGALMGVGMFLLNQKVITTVSY